MERSHGMWRGGRLPSSRVWEESWQGESALLVMKVRLFSKVE